MVFRFVGDDVHNTMSNWEPEENIFSYKTSRDYKPINSKLFSSSRDCTDWLYQVQAGPAMVSGKRD